jgi:quercetin dioxygenase-like cupin family protein
MSEATVQIGCVANLWSKMMVFEKVGDREVGHTHLFDHLTLLAAGALDVEVDGVKTNFVAPQMIYIKAGKVHELTATAPNTVAYCIHALRSGDGVDDILDPSMIPEGVHPQMMAKPLIET